MNCTGQCDTCNVDHSVESANRGHGISYSPLAIQYAQNTKYLNKDANFQYILIEDDDSVFMGEFGGPACGDIVNLWVKVDNDKVNVEKFTITFLYSSILATLFSIFLAQFGHSKPCKINL